MLLKHNPVYMINRILFYMQNCIFTNLSSPAKKKYICLSFRKEMEHYSDNIRFSIKQKAVKTVKVCKRFNIFI